MTRPIEEALATGGKPTTPEDWMSYLVRKLDNETRATDIYADYYDGIGNQLAFAQEKFKTVFGSMFVGWQDNFCRLIVDSISERLSIKGFRFGGDENADKDASDMWQRNYLDADSNAAHIDALVRGKGAIIVWGDEDDQPVISPEPASQVTVQYRAGSRRTIEAAVKRYFDDWGGEFATLWLPDRIFTGIKDTTKGWMVDEQVKPNPLGVVPVVPLSNRSRLLTAGSNSKNRKDCQPLSELHNIIKIQDAINKVSADAIVASEFAAFPQRVIAGLEQFEDDATQEAAMLKAYVDRILTFDGEDVKWGQFEPADLGNYVKLIDMLVQHMASQSRVPFHYFLLNGGAAPSGESITAAEAGLVAKAKERMLHFGESWEIAMRLAFKVLGDKRAEAFDCETIWADPEHRSKAVLVDSLLKLKDIGVPMKQLQEDYGYSPPTIARFAQMRKDELQEEIARAKAMAPVTGAQGGSAPAGNGSKANQPKNAAVERQQAKARAA
jgi:hypothetical protein